jgi:hypothetical protein
MLLERASYTRYFQTDNLMRFGSKGLVKPHFTCNVHKDYRAYQEELLGYKNWCIVICTFMTIPLVLFGWFINLNLAWTYYFMGVLISSSVIPISLAMTWPRASAEGMISGVVVGCLCGIISWLSFASTYDGGLTAAHFISNTGKVRTTAVFFALLYLLCSLFYFLPASTRSVPPGIHFALLLVLVLLWRPLIKLVTISADS